jgi:hypothetical protein
MIKETWSQQIIWDVLISETFLNGDLTEITFHSLYSQIKAIKLNSLEEKLIFLSIFQAVFETLTSFINACIIPNAVGQYFKFSIFKEIGLNKLWTAICRLNHTLLTRPQAFENTD